MKNNLCKKGKAFFFLNILIFLISFGILFSILTLAQSDEMAINVTAKEENIIKAFLSLILDKLSFTSGESIPIKAHLSYEDGNPAPNAKIQFYVDSTSIGSETTNGEGLAQLRWDTKDLQLGEHTISVSYSSDAEEITESATISLEEGVTEVV